MDSRDSRMKEEKNDEGDSARSLMLTFLATTRSIQSPLHNSNGALYRFPMRVKQVTKTLKKIWR